MKITIKKKYIVGLSMLCSGVSGYLIFQEVIMLLINRGLHILLIPTVFTFSTIYVVVYWTKFHQSVGIATEVSKEQAQGDSKEQYKIKEHLINKIFNEAYTINFLYGKIIFTNSWYKQQEIDKVNDNKNIPEVIRNELLNIKPTKHSGKLTPSVRADQRAQAIADNLKKNLINELTPSEQAKKRGQALVDNLKKNLTNELTRSEQADQGAQALVRGLKKNVQS